MRITLQWRTFLFPLGGRRAERAEGRLGHGLAAQPVRLRRRLGPRDAGARPGRRGRRLGRGRRLRWRLLGLLLLRPRGLLGDAAAALGGLVDAAVVIAL